MRMVGSRGDGGTDPPPEKSQHYIGFPSNTGPDPQKSHKVTKPAFNVGPSMYDRRFVGGPMLVRLWWYLDRLSPHQLRKPRWQNFLDLRKMRKLV